MAVVCDGCPKTASAGLGGRAGASSQEGQGLHPGALWGVCSAALEDPLSTGTTVFVTAAVVTNVVGVAIVSGNAHGLSKNVIASCVGAGTEGNTLASPATVGDARSGASFAKWRKRVTGDLTVALAWIDIGNAETVADLWSISATVAWWW